MHRVSYSVGWTKNMGNFESLRVDLGLEADGDGNPKVTLDRVRKFVEHELGEAVAEVTAQISGDAEGE